MIPDVSVLIPYRDAEGTLEEALDGVLAERAPSLEVLLVDDGSVDAGPELASRLAARHRALRLLSSGGDGLVSALERGRAEARAPLIARMDADDVSIPGRFEAQREALLARPNVAALGSRVEAFPSAAVEGGLARYVAWQNDLLTPEDHAQAIFVESPLCHPSVMMWSAAVDAVGGYRAGDWAEDWDLWLRLDAAGYQLAKLPEVWLRWRHLPGRATFTDPRYRPEAMLALRASFLARRIRVAAKPLTIWGAGRTGKRLARELEGHGLSVARFVDIDPRKVGRVARGAPIVDPPALSRADGLVVVAVGARGAREEVRAHLLEGGFVEGDDFLCAA